MTPIFLMLLFTFCQSNTQNTETASVGAKETVAERQQSSLPAYQMKPDTIVIRGKFLTGCNIPGNVKIAIHNVDNTFWKDVPVNATGEFVFKHYLAEPRRVAVRNVFGTKFDFFATTDEKNYNLEITCEGRNETFNIKDSKENLAYILFSESNKNHQTNLDSLGKMDLSKKENFSLVQKTITDYQKTLSEIAAAHPSTFTAKMFCATDILPEGSLNSLETLRANFLKRDAYSQPLIFNDFLPQRILLNYIAIREKNKGADEAVETLMSIGLKNREAAKRLQDMMNSIFYKMHQEDLVTAFINWADRNPEKLYNQSVKGRLQQLKKVVAGNDMMDFELKDPAGKSQKLSETVKSGQLTALIFYSPTCGHCKEKVPELIPLWEKYQSKGLRIYAVGNNSKVEDWKKFIEGYAKPEWVHVFQEEDGPQPSGMYYASNPTFILIDGEGKIVSRIWNIEHVIEMINQKFS